MKPFKTHAEQLEILKARKMIVPNDRFATRVLSYENYYTVINGYKDIFINSTVPNDAYRPGATFNEIVALYTFDRRLRELLLIELLRIEHVIRTKIIYIFSEHHGHKHTSYLRTESFNTESFTNFKRVNFLIFDLLRLIDKHKDNHKAISHYLKDYGYVPLWVLSKVMTFGKLNSFYSCLLNKEKIIIANNFGLTPDVFKTLVDLLADIRNKCAHGERIYCYSKDREKSRPISSLRYHKLLHIPKNNKGYKYGTEDILALLIAMKYFMHKDRYSHLIRHIDYALHGKLEKRLHSVSITYVENIMGLINTWTDLKDL